MLVDLCLKDLLVVFRQFKSHQLPQIIQLFKFARTIPHQKNRIEMYSVNMAYQIGTYDCGLIAIAYTFELCLNNNPANLEFDQSTMRAHYNTCIANRRLIAFKKIQKKLYLITSFIVYEYLSNSPFSLYFSLICIVMV